MLQKIARRTHLITALVFALTLSGAAGATVQPVDGAMIAGKVLQSSTVPAPALLGSDRLATAR